MITAYFEFGTHSQKIATFDTEEMYLKCLPALKEAAKSFGVAGVTISEVEHGEPFPNGFESWHETHFEIVGMIEHSVDAMYDCAATRRVLDQGTGGLYELAQEWTDEFEELHHDRVWDGEFRDEIEKFFKSKNQIKL